MPFPQSCHEELGLGSAPEAAQQPPPIIVSLGCFGVLGQRSGRAGWCPGSGLGVPGGDSWLGRAAQTSWNGSEQGEKGDVGSIIIHNEFGMENWSSKFVFRGGFAPSWVLGGGRRG